MKVNQKVYLNKDTELKTFYYNNDTQSKDHETEHHKAGTKYVVSGYVMDKSNALSQNEADLESDTVSIVLKNESTLEVYRVSKSLFTSNFNSIELN